MKKFKLFLILLILFIYLPAQADMAKVPTKINKISHVSAEQITLNTSSTPIAKTISTKVGNVLPQQTNRPVPQKSADNSNLFLTIAAACGAIVFLTAFLIFISKLRTKKSVKPLNGQQYEVSNAVASFVRHRIRR
jgi:hypothetical protein